MKEYIKRMWAGKSKYLMLLIGAIALISGQWWVFIVIPVVFAGKSIVVYKQIKKDKETKNQSGKKNAQDLEEEQLDLEQRLNQPQRNQNMGNNHCIGRSDRTNEQNNQTPNNMQNNHYNTGVNTTNMRSNAHQRIQETSPRQEEEQKIDSQANSELEEQKQEPVNNNRRAENLQFLYNIGSTIYNTVATRNPNQSDGGVRQFDIEAVRNMNPSELFAAFRGNDRNIKQEVIKRFVELGLTSIRDGMQEDKKVAIAICEVFNNINNNLLKFHGVTQTITANQRIINECLLQMSQRGERMITVTENLSKYIDKKAQEIDAICKEMKEERRIRNDEYAQRDKEQQEYLKQKNEELKKERKQRDKEQQEYLKQKNEELKKEREQRDKEQQEYLKQKNEERKKYLEQSKQEKDEMFTNMQSQMDDLAKIIQQRQREDKEKKSANWQNFVGKGSQKEMPDFR